MTVTPSMIHPCLLKGSTTRSLKRYGQSSYPSCNPLSCLFSRYEDFTTIGMNLFGNASLTKLNIRKDWIQDSILERNRRLKHAGGSSTIWRHLLGSGRLSRFWGHVQRGISLGQSWFVVSLVGVFSLVYFQNRCF
jgi:hypothetical protein